MGRTPSSRRWRRSSGSTSSARHGAFASRGGASEVGRKAIVVGSGAGGAVAAMVLAERGWHVVVFEKGPNYVGDLRDPSPRSLFSNDELKSGYRGFEDPDTVSEPRTYRKHKSQKKPLAVGDVNDIPSTVGGGTIHWDAKTPR